jgi:hypothetical protein
MRRGDAPRYAYANTNTPPRLTGSSGVASPGQQDANLPTLKMFRTRKIAEANGCLFPDVRKEPKSERYRQKCLREARRQATGKSCLLATRGASTDLLPRDGRDPKPLAARTACPTNICRFHAIVPAVGGGRSGSAVPFPPPLSQKRPWECSRRNGQRI